MWCGGIFCSTPVRGKNSPLITRFCVSIIKNELNCCQHLENDKEKQYIFQLYRRHKQFKQLNYEKIMIYFLLPAMPPASFCQKTNDSVQVVKTDYLTRSKNQKTAAWILLGGGTALIGIVSLLVIVSNLLLMMPLQALLLQLSSFYCIGKKQKKCLKYVCEF